MQRDFVQYAAVPVVPTAAAGDVANPTPKKLVWDLQTITFVLSMLFQLATLIVSAVTLSGSGGSNPSPPLLIFVVTSELVIQAVEITWYSVVGVLYYFGELSIGVKYRYWDWMITTPVGLVALIIFVWYLECQSADFGILAESSRIWAIVTIVVMDLLMLAIGYAYEAELGVRKWINMLVPCFGESKNEYSLTSYRGLFLGWIPFVGIFAPMVVALITAEPTGNVFGYAIFAVSITAFTWALYGVVALVFRSPASAKNKNASYNLLDIVSKNIVGLVTSVVALNLSSGQNTAQWNMTCVSNSSSSF